MASKEIQARYNVRGFYYEVDQGLLYNNSNSKLTELWQQKAEGSDTVYCNKDPFVFSAIVDYYKTGLLHVPDSCVHKITVELQFWNIPQDALCSCCAQKLRESESKAAETNILLTTWRQYGPGDGQSGQLHGMAYRIHHFLEGDKPSILAQVYAWFIILLGVLSAVLACVETLPIFKTYRLVSSGDIQVVNPKGNRLIIMIQYVILVILCVDITVRFVVHPSKLAFIRSPINIVAVVSTVPVWIIFNVSFIVDIGILWQITRLVQTTRVFYVLRLSRFCVLLRVMMCAVAATGYMLPLLSFLTILTALVYGYFVYLLEMNSVDSHFRSAGDGLWWAVITMTTVGYGDMRPISAGGKVVGILCAMTGVIYLVLPIPILTRNFFNYYTISKMVINNDNPGGTRKAINVTPVMSNIQNMDTHVPV